MPTKRKGNRRTEHVFSQVPTATIPRSQFNRSHTHKTTFDAGFLIPIYLDEVLPGDTFNLNLTMFARLATPIYPIMDNMSLDVFFFFVPNRLVWDNWQKFCGEQKNPADSISFTIPVSNSGSGGAAGGLELRDYMGIPPGKTNTNVNALPLRAYNLIWNEWFRDQNLQNSVIVDTDDGPDDYADHRFLLQRGKRHDYFTSSLPWPQKQTAAVSLPLGTVAPVVATTAGLPSFDVGTATDVKMQHNTGQADFAMSWSADPTTATPQATWNTTGLEADLSTATAATINAIREAFQIQKLLERDARGGTRYTELVKSHFGVSSPDARLQRPEYLGGGSTPVIISAVAQTVQKTTAAGWTQTTAGTLAAFGTAAGGGMGFNKSFVEHGYIIGLVSARADLTYQQGLHKLWSRSTRYDFYWPAFANLGEQAIKNQEIYFQDDDAGGAPPNDDNNKVFGYQERWAEYRYAPSMISGAFRSQFPTPLHSWHLAQEFLSLPVLGDTFIKDTPPVDRVIAVNTEPHFIFDAYFQIKCARPMPVYSIPGLIDHF